MALFSPSLISPQVTKSLKQEYTIRPLEKGDYGKGKGEIAPFVEDIAKSRVIGAGSVVVERKFVHGCGLVGHIEDIVTAESARGLNLGRLIIETLKEIGRQTGCYKS
ncbi:Glucosamine-phosphate N-acetyltransferase-like protein [Chytriomyces hyalinus]|nr:Glucosamine-phosphate N-acetyltransferase-like protein [Chytriomyces hyalinus]